MENSLLESPEAIKSFLRSLDKVLLDEALGWARRCYIAILEGLDKALAEHRSKKLTIEHRRGVWHQTCLGAVKVRRRQYGDGKGGYRYLLDEVMGMGKYWHTTGKVQEAVLELASTMPYRKSAEVLEELSAMDLSHQTIWRLVARIADLYLKEADGKLKWFLDTGEIPEGEGKQVARLLMEADGVMLSLQREKERKAEVKVGIAYEEWAKVGKDRYRTVNKTAFADVAGDEAFWAGMSLKLQETYDLSRVRDTIVGGDGAGWVKEGASYVHGQFQLDHYHLNRELCAALGKDKKTRGIVWEACKSGDVETGLRILADSMRQAKGEQSQKIMKAYRYLQENSSGLKDYRLELGEEGKNLRRTGAMEGNVDKLVVRRMKNQGMSWSTKGIRRLLCIRLLVLEKKLTGWLQKANATDVKLDLPREKARRVFRRFFIQDPDQWLQAELPALRGPHSSRPWVRALKALMGASAL